MLFNKIIIITLFIIGIYINVLQCPISIVATGIRRISVYGMAWF